MASDFAHLLIIGEDEQFPDPEWAAIEAAASGVSPRRSVVLYKANGQHIRADGAKFVHTIVFYENAASPCLVVGRLPGSRRRGKTTLDGDLIIASSLEYWAQDGLEVFRTFHAGESLARRFTLRDPAQVCSRDQIRDAIG